MIVSSRPSIYSSPFSALWPGKRTVAREISATLRAAEMAAKRVLNDKEQGGNLDKYGGQSYRVRKYEDIFWDFARTAIICLGGRSSQGKEIGFIAGVISFIVGLTSSYFIGRNWVALSEAGKQLNRVRRERSVLLPAFRQCTGKNKQMQKILKVVKLEEAIFSKIKQYAEYGLAVKVTLFVSSLFGLVAVLNSSASLLIFAVGLGMATSVASLVGEGFSFSENERRSAAVKLLETLDTLQRHITY